MTMNPTTAVFLCYTGVIFFIAIKAFQVTRDPAGFLLANRELNSWRAALSAGASDMSGWLLLGLPGLAFIAHAEALWMALGLATGTWLNWKFIAKPLREKSVAHHDALTLPSYFANRFPEQATALRVTTALTILIFYTIYLAAGMVAAAKLFVAIFSIPYPSALCAGSPHRNLLYHARRIQGCGEHRYPSGLDDDRCADGDKSCSAARVIRY